MNTREKKALNVGKHKSTSMNIISKTEVNNRTGEHEKQNNSILHRGYNAKK